jgi:type II secretory pathway pseudopilin PulG
MTAPPPPQPPPDTQSLAGAVLASSERTNVAWIKVHWLALVVIAILGILLLWVVPGYVAGIRDGYRRDRDIAALGAAAKSNAAKAVFWQSEATKKAVAVVHDTQVVTRVVASAPRYIYTDTGMRQVPLAPAVPEPDAYTRAADFDSLASAAATMHRDFDLQIAAIDSGLTHVQLEATEFKSRGDTLAVALTAEKKAERLRIVKAAAGGVAAGAVAVVILRGVLH